MTAAARTQPEEPIIPTTDPHLAAAVARATVGLRSEHAEVEARQRFQIDALKRYCLADVVQTAFLFLRSRLLKGQLPRPAYRQVAEAWLAAVSADPRTAPLAEKADRQRLLLSSP